MKALLDTNIIIHREAGRVTNLDIGILYKYLEKAKYEKCIHPLTIEEIKKNPNKDTVNTFLAKLGNYTEILSPAPINQHITDISKKFDHNANDLLDSNLLNEVYCNRVDILISEDKKVHRKAESLGITDKVFTIESFLERITGEFPALVDYKVLNVRQVLFGQINLSDPFFDSLKEDYPGFEQWFDKKASEKAYITYNATNSKLLSFLYLKREDKDEVYSDIEPIFKPKKRLKVGTFKVVGNGVRLGERFLKIIFDNALANRVEEIYVTIFDKREEQKRLIELMKAWGFNFWGMKGDEQVYVRDFRKKFNTNNPRFSYPFTSKLQKKFMVSIEPQYHTELLPDSILRTESPLDFIDDHPHRNAINKVFISHSFERKINKGDIIIFYRMGETYPKVYSSVISTIGLAIETDINIKSEDEFVAKCKNRSVYNEVELRQQWNKFPKLKPFILSFLYVYSFPNRVNLKGLIEAGIIANVESAPRGFTPITEEQFQTIIKLTKTDESFIID